MLRIYGHAHHPNEYKRKEDVSFDCGIYLDF